MTATGFQFDGTPECGTQDNLLYEEYPEVMVITGNSGTRNSRTARSPQGFMGPFNSLTISGGGTFTLFDDDHNGQFDMVQITGDVVDSQAILLAFRHSYPCGDPSRAVLKLFRPADC